VPELNTPPLRIAIQGTAPPPKPYPAGTKEFRYWTAAEALRRGADFWAAVLPAGVTWFSTVGPRLRVGLDQGVDLNAFYDRSGLQFFHDTVGGKTVFSGESPDIVCHELGHAVLDALRPQLFDAMSDEVAAFHEGFGDISGMLAALQLASVRHAVLDETGGRLDRNSRLSRLAEQLGWAIRQGHPDAVDRDCLRNAVNSFFYLEPESLPPSAPASMLSSEPHSFSRVFTAAFLEAMAGMLIVQSGSGGTPSEADLLQVSRDAGALLVEAIVSSPVVPGYYSQIAAHMIEAAGGAQGKYHDALKSGFVRHGILSLESVGVLSRAGAAATPRRAAAAGAGARARMSTEALPRVQLAAADFGLGDEALWVHAPAEPVRFQVAGAARAFGSVTPPSHDQAAKSFTEDLFRRGRVMVAAHGRAATLTAYPAVMDAHKTHEVKREAAGLVLVRRWFDCGFHAR
jgi:hypothetical protein